MQSDQLLVVCPKCHAWPMAVHAGKRRWASDAPVVRFTCAKCGHQEEERLGGSYAKRESSQQHEIAGGGFQSWLFARAPEDFPSQGARMRPMTGSPQSNPV
jgi:hypothetical protein